VFLLSMFVVALRQYCELSYFELLRKKIIVVRVIRVKYPLKLFDSPPYWNAIEALLEFRVPRLWSMMFVHGELKDIIHFVAINVLRFGGRVPT
jgi:hypothetical protein